MTQHTSLESQHIGGAKGEALEGKSWLRASTIVLNWERGGTHGVGSRGGNSGWEKLVEEKRPHAQPGKSLQR